MKSLLDALEIDLHEAIVLQIAPIVTVEMLLGAHFEKVERRARDHGTTNPEHFSEYLDLGDIIELLSTHKDRLTSETRDGLREIRSQVIDILPIRNRVAHPIRVIEPTDFERVTAAAQCASASVFPTPELDETLRDSDRQPKPRPEHKPLQRSYAEHNLPRPEFDETGLIGRERLRSRVANMLATRRDNVVTLVGPGGVGKTALAVQALSDLVFDSECPYDLVLWSTLKTERLTHEGIQEIASAVSAVTQLEDSVSRTLDDEGRGLEWISQSIEGFETLVVIDNLETTNTDEFLSVYDAFPATCTYLVTSREGIGQLERRVEVEPLDSTSAARLLRALAETQNANWLKRAPAATAEDICGRLRNSPLAIKWFVLAVAAGADPQSRLENQEELLRFCVDSVWHDLSGLAVSACRHLAALPARSSSFSEMVTFLDEDTDRVRRAVHQLQQRAMVRISFQEDRGLDNSISLTETAGEYIDKIHPITTQERDAARRLRKDLEAREAVARQREASIDLRTTAVFVPQEIRGGVVKILSSAVVAEGDVNSAKARLKRAEQLAPGFFEVDRIRAQWAEREGSWGEAEGLYTSAREKATNDTERAIVDFHHGSLLAYRVRDHEAALACFRRAHDTLRTKMTGFHLGKALSRTSEWEEGLELLEAVSQESIGTAYDSCAAAILSNFHARAVRSDAATGVAVLSRALDRVEELAEDRLLLSEADGEFRALVGASLSIVLRNPQVASASDLFERAANAAGLYWRTWHRTDLWADVEHVAQSGKALPDGLRRTVSETRQFVNRPLAMNEGTDGYLRHFDANRSFGFITTGRRDVFFHVTKLDGIAPITLIPGRPLRVVARAEDRGPAAVHVSCGFGGSVPRSYLRSRVAVTESPQTARDVIAGVPIRLAGLPSLPSGVEVQGHIRIVNGGAQFATSGFQTADDCP